MEITVDQRLEFLTALVVAYKEKITKNAEKFYWIKYPDNDYVHSLVDEISIENYPEVYLFLEKIYDCSWYSQLYFYFDEEMNYNGNFPLEIHVFRDLAVSDFAREVHKIYVERNIKRFFILHKEDNQNLVDFTKSIMFSSKSVENDMQKLYGMKLPKNFIVVSLLLKGGFGPSYEGNTYFLRGISFENNQFVFNEKLFIKQYFHEASHPIVNPLIDKYSGGFDIDDKLLEEAINMGLPKCYMSLHILLCEYFVRVNEFYLVKKYISKKYYSESINFIKNNLGFIYIEDLINVLETTRTFYNTYEEVLQYELLPCLEKISERIKLTNQKN